MALCQLGTRREVWKEVVEGHSSLSTCVTAQRLTHEEEAGLWPENGQRIAEETDKSRGLLAMSNVVSFVCRVR